MQNLTKKDTISAIVTGLITGLAVWRISVFLGTLALFGIPVAAFPIIVPICWVLGVLFGYFLGQWVKFFNQFGKFVAIGFTNGAVDFSVLYILIAYSGHDTGTYYAVFKSISFIFGMLHSYFWNKTWAFEASTSGGGQGEFMRFFGVTVVTFLVNVGVASGVVSWVTPVFGITTQGWAGVGAAVGSAAGITFSFVGFRLFVFKR